MCVISVCVYVRVCVCVVCVWGCVLLLLICPSDRTRSWCLFAACVCITKTVSDFSVQVSANVIDVGLLLEQLITQ